jgi:hypothetical protein
MSTVCSIYADGARPRCEGLDWVFTSGMCETRHRIVEALLLVKRNTGIGSRATQPWAAECSLFTATRRSVGNRGGLSFAILGRCRCLQPA